MKKLLTLSLILVFGSISQVNAATITLDCTAGCSLTAFGGALWSTQSIQPSGTGVFEPFVRLQASGTDTNEDGHNTDAVPVNDEKTGTWTHSVLTSDLDNVVAINNALFYEFMLDIGEPDAAIQSPLSLDQLKICTASAGNLTQLNDCPTASTYSIDTLVDSSVLLDYNLFGGGNGNSDLFVYIPKAFIGNGTYFYMYSAFGYELGYHADGSFEEWAFREHETPVCPTCPPDDEPPDDDPPPNVVPEPGSMILLGSGLVYLIRKRVKRAS